MSFNAACFWRGVIRGNVPLCVRSIGGNVFICDSPVLLGCKNTVTSPTTGKCTVSKLNYLIFYPVYIMILGKYCLLLPAKHCKC